MIHRVASFSLSIVLALAVLGGLQPSPVAAQSTSPTPIPWDGSRPLTSADIPFAFPAPDDFFVEGLQPFDVGASLIPNREARGLTLYEAHYASPSGDLIKIYLVPTMNLPVFVDAGLSALAPYYEEFRTNLRDRVRGGQPEYQESINRPNRCFRVNEIWGFHASPAGEAGAMLCDSDVIGAVILVTVVGFEPSDTDAFGTYNGLRWVTEITVQAYLDSSP